MRWQFTAWRESVLRGRARALPVVEMAATWQPAQTSGPPDRGVTPPGWRRVAFCFLGVADPLICANICSMPRWVASRGLALGPVHTRQQLGLPARLTTLHNGWHGLGTIDRWSTARLAAAVSAINGPKGSQICNGGGARSVTIDRVSRAHWETCFENRFLKEQGVQFQQLFWAIMERTYPGDFQRVVPWGSVGDLKSDGYLPSQQRLFQCYGPKSLDAKATIQKIDADYNGAIEHWGEYFTEWTFVHNALDGGLPAPVAEKLAALTAQNPSHPARPWGFAELRTQVFLMSESDLMAFLGPAPTIRTMLTIGADDLAPLIDHISTANPPVSSTLEPVPPGKLDANLFTAPYRELIEAGFVRTSLVREYFRKHHEPMYQDRAATWFRDSYRLLRAQGLSADDIYDRLRDLVGGVGPANARRQSAVMAVTSYFFETCDIFEPASTPGDAPAD